MEVIGTALDHDERTTGVPIYWDELELSANSTQFPCIQFKPRNWSPQKGCEYERILEIRVLHNSEDKRAVITQLFDFEESIRKILEHNILNNPEFNWFEMDLLGGSEFSGMSYNKPDIDSYKGTKTLFSSVITLYYSLRY